MNVSVINPQFQTAIFIILLVGLIVLTAKKDSSPHEMNHSHTNELKGAAILMVLFSHIGYFLFSDHKFLFPLSIAGGVGVNIFLFLSGFGLTSSEAKAKKSISHFYSKRLGAIFIPMWLVLIATLVFDAYLLSKTYSVTTVVQSFFGFFPNADIDSAINSPLWYFSLILFYYLIFPLVYQKSRPILSAGVVLALGYLTTGLNLPVSKDVHKLYELHYLAFPLGMLFANFYKNKPVAALKENLLRLTLSPKLISFVSYVLILVFLFIFGYAAVHSGVGEKINIEQSISIISVAILVPAFLIKDVKSDFLILLGRFSYEIYLIQWPIMYRHDFIYKYTPAFLGTLFYIALFLSIGFVLNGITKTILKSSGRLYKEL
jgi:peptidoglycan/LPS O-acetylase OafA/YrhL